MTKPYRIKHKASGYFYQRYNGSNLGKKGKVYMNNQSPLTMFDNENFIRIQIRHNTLAYKALKDMLAKYIIGKDDECEYHSTSYRVPKSEFEKEELQRMEKKVLTLSVSKQWFDMIADERKDEEYREIKPYWASRLVNQQAEGGDVLFDEFGGYCSVIGKLQYKPYTHVLFINGYRKDSPRIEKEIESITIGKPKKGLCPDKWLNTEFFIIKFK